MRKPTRSIPSAASGGWCCIPRTVRKIPRPSFPKRKTSRNCPRRCRQARIAQPISSPSTWISRWIPPACSRARRLFRRARVLVKDGKFPSNTTAFKSHARASLHPLGSRSIRGANPKAVSVAIDPQSGDPRRQLLFRTSDGIKPVHDFYEDNMTRATWNVNPGADASLGNFRMPRAASTR